jgi:hypothetical protein
MDTLQPLRNRLIANLCGGQAYDTFEEIVGEFSPGLRGAIPAGAEHSAWQILEHLRISQRDILDFCRNQDGSYQEKNWPEDYWPRDTAPSQPKKWDVSIEAFLADRAALEALVKDDNRDLFAPFPWGDGQTLLREALLAADHAGYHLGQLVILRRLL